MSDKSRFSDDSPFLPPQNKQEREWMCKRDEATRIWRETGDDSMAIEIGLFPKKGDDQMHTELHYSDHTFSVARTSDSSATITFNCDDSHRHEPLNVGRMSPEMEVENGADAPPGWGIGRDKLETSFVSPFTVALKLSADILLSECNAASQLDEFFDEDTQSFYDIEE